MRSAIPLLLSIYPLAAISYPSCLSTSSRFRRSSEPTLPARDTQWRGGRSLWRPSTDVTTVAAVARIVLHTVHRRAVQAGQRAHISDHCAFRDYVTSSALQDPV